VVGSVAVTAVIALGAGIAAGHDRRFDSETDFGHGINITTGAHIFHGTVSSERDACEPKRKVTVLRKKPGDDRAIGSDKSNATGAWEVEVAAAKDGDYYARVKRRNIGEGQHDHLCLKARSETISVS
jgi:hypothetical protein